MWLRNSRLQIVFQISSPKVVWQNLLGNYIKFLVKNPKITRKIAVFTRAAIRSPKIEKILFSRIQPSETLDYESFPKFRPRKWRVRNWLSTPVARRFWLPFDYFWPLPSVSLLRRPKKFLGIQFFFLQKNPTELTKFLVSSAGPPRALARGARKFVNFLEPVTNKKSQGP